MTAVYEQSDVRFMYPENWELDNREDSSRPWSVSVHSPGGAFWSITVYDEQTDLEWLRKETLQAVHGEFEESYFESDEVIEEIAGQPSEGYNMHFYYLDFLVAAKLRSFRLRQHSCVILYQAEDREFDQLERVFQAITHSLFRPEMELPKGAAL